jgi:hypothetical protein
LSFEKKIKRGRRERIRRKIIKNEQGDDYLAETMKVMPVSS